MSTDRRERDAWAQVKARGEDRRANDEAAPIKLNRDNQIESKASPARLMGVKQKTRKSSIAFIIQDQADSMWLP